MSKVRNELLRLAKLNNDSLTPDMVIETARNPKSVLHDHFEWNDSRAADKYRRNQAQALIRTITLQIQRVPEKTRTVKLEIFSTKDRGHYKLLQMRRDTLRDKNVLTCRQELESIRRRYEMLPEFSDIWLAIDALSNKRRRTKS